jgi:hypothetical protein
MQCARARRLTNPWFCLFILIEILPLVLWLKPAKDELAARLLHGGRFELSKHYRVSDHPPAAAVHRNFHPVSPSAVAVVRPARR